MQFVFDNNRSPNQQRIFDAAVRSNWLVSDIFNKPTVCSFETEKQRLLWAPVLASLAFGESTAFSGFGQRIAVADDLSTKTWLSVHLLDESKHSEGFSALLDHFYPASQGQQHKLFKSRDTLVFYGLTHKTNNLLQWLMCTQIAEVFSMQCYKSLYKRLNGDPLAKQFIGNIIADEGRHIAYMNSLIDQRKAELSDQDWRENYHPFASKMINHARQMFEARRRGANYNSFRAMDIDVTRFCDDAEAELSSKMMRKKAEL